MYGPEGLLRHAALPDNHWLQIITFTKRNISTDENVFDDICRIDRWSFWSLLDVNRSTFDDDMREKKTIFTFRSQCPWPLTFRPQICFTSYSCPALCLHRIRSFYGFPVARQSEAWYGRTDGRTGWKHLMQPCEEGRIISAIVTRCWTTCGRNCRPKSLYECNTSPLCSIYWRSVWQWRHQQLSRLRRVSASSNHSRREHCVETNQANRTIWIRPTVKFMLQSTDNV